MSNKILTLYKYLENRIKTKTNIEKGIIGYKKRNRCTNELLF